jgi:hypothetical protein
MVGVPHGRDNPHGVGFSYAVRFGKVARMVKSSERAEPPLRGFFRRLVASDAELEAEELLRTSVQTGCTKASDARRGEMVAVTGRLRTVVYTPRTNWPTLEADLFDGSDSVTLVWLGRRRIAGIEPGRHLTAKGRMAVRDDRKVIYNPYYELEPPR